MNAYLTRYDRIQTVISLYPQQLVLDLAYNKQIESWYLHADEEKKLKVYVMPLESKSQTVEELSQILQVNGF